MNKLMYFLMLLLVIETRVAAQDNCVKKYSYTISYYDNFDTTLIDVLNKLEKKYKLISRNDVYRYININSFESDTVSFSVKYVINSKSSKANCENNIYWQFYDSDGLFYSPNLDTNARLVNSSILKVNKNSYYVEYWLNISLCDMFSCTYLYEGKYDFECNFCSGHKFKSKRKQSKVLSFKIIYKRNFGIVCMGEECFW